MSYYLFSYDFTYRLAESCQCMPMRSPGRTIFGHIFDPTANNAGCHAFGNDLAGHRGHPERQRSASHPSMGEQRGGHTHIHSEYVDFSSDACDGSSDARVGFDFAGGGPSIRGAAMRQHVRARRSIPAHCRSHRQRSLRGRREGFGDAGRLLPRHRLPGLWAPASARRVHAAAVGQGPRSVKHADIINQAPRGIKRAGVVRHTSISTPARDHRIS